MAEIYLRKSKLSDLDDIMEIIDEAKALLKKDGSPQWQDGHPDRKQFEIDINNGFNWVLIVDDNIAGTATLSTQIEDNYKNIEDGKWNGDDHYLTIHRVAIASRFRGMQLSKQIFSNLLTVGRILNYSDFRIDTHPVNIRMQKLITDFGFKRRGTVHVEDKIDSRRFAYELNMN